MQNAAANVGGLWLGGDYEGQFLCDIINSTTLQYYLPNTDAFGSPPSPAPGIGNPPYVTYGRRLYDTCDPRLPWTMLPPTY